MTLIEALDADFDTYMRWCRNYIWSAAARDPIIGLVLGIDDRLHWDGATSLFLEAAWARRYYYHHVNKLETPR